MSPYLKSFLYINQNNKITFLRIFLLFFTALVFFSCGPAKRTIGPRLSDITFNKNIRVYLDELPSSYNLKIKEGGFLKNALDETLKLEKNSTVNFSLANGFIKVDDGNKTFISSAFKVVPLNKTGVNEYKGKKYRGELKFFTADNKLYIVNELPVEDYLKGVLPLEMGNISGNGNIEALKAFSIIARNFAYMKLEQKGKLFDVYADTRDQVYGGSSVEKEMANKAVNETEGLILTYEHSPAKVFYFSSCGGATEEVGNVFSEKDIPYLTTVKDTKEPNCSIAPSFNWKEKYTGSTIIKRLYENKLVDNKKSKLVNAEIKSRFKSGRVNELCFEVESPEGSTREVKVYSNNIRKILKAADGVNILRSTMFDMDIKKDEDDVEIVLSGKGNGHGVGLCQWGAISKSRSGSTYNEILYFYFPGTRIEKIND